MINISKIDIQKLIDTIEKKRDAGCNINYLIMNRKTLDEIAYRQNIFISSGGRGTMVFNFQGIDVAICAQAFDIVECNILPEKVLYDYIKGMLSQKG